MQEKEINVSRENEMSDHSSRKYPIPPRPSVHGFTLRRRKN